MNTLYYGDNLDILRRYIKDESVDLIYLDPPFNSNATYNVLYKEPTGKPSEAQITAFEDTWHWTPETDKTFQEIVKTAPATVIEMMSAFRKFVGLNDVMAYLTMMCIRLLELRRVLKPTGSIYLHCDPTASHYLKILMDSIFGASHFRSEIIWRRSSGFKRVTAKKFPQKNDILLFYTKTDDHYFKTQYRPHKPEYIKRFKPDKNGRLCRTDVNPTGGGTRTIYLDDVKGDIIDSIWNDIYPVNPISKERLGYPTQKPEALLERIIQASSEEGAVVLDPFCGCGTTITAAQKMGRTWLGIDITHLAINLIKWRLKNMFGLEPKKDYLVVGEPEDLAGAQDLFGLNRYQFQWWASSLINAKPYGDKKKGADTGIDGWLFFSDEEGEYKKAVVQVKGGKTDVKDIRDLGHVIDREKAEIGILITLQDPTKPMIKEALQKGYYHSKTFDKDYPRIQIMTIEELLAGKQPDVPNLPSTSDFIKKAPAVSLTPTSEFDFED